MLRSEGLAKKFHLTLDYPDHFERFYAPSRSLFGKFLCKGF